MFRQPLPSLLPFVPILRGGNEEPVIRRALQELRSDADLNELEPLLAFFASFVLESRLVQQIMRWDMTVLRESPWYQEILTEGLQQGREQGLEQGLERGLERGLKEGALRQLLRVLNYRFGPALSPDIREYLAGLTTAQLEALVDAALDARSLDQFRARLPVPGGNGADTP